MPKANKEDYVLKQLQKLLGMIEEIYDDEERFLIPPDYLEVRAKIEEITKNHSANMGTLNEMNSIYRRNRLIKKIKDKYKEFMPFDKALEKICKDAFETSKWSGAWETFIHYTDLRGYTANDITEYLSSIGIHDPTAPIDDEDVEEIDDEGVEDVKEDSDNDFDMPF